MLRPSNLIPIRLFLFGLQHLLPVEATLGFSYSDSVDLSLSMRNGSRRGREVLWDHSVTQAWWFQSMVRFGLWGERPEKDRGEIETEVGSRSPGLLKCASPFKREETTITWFFGVWHWAWFLISQACQVTCSLTVLVFTLTASSYYYYALLPAWEADSSLDWTKSSTLLVNWSTTLCEALGLLVAGPLADYLEPVPLIALEGSVTFLGIFIACIQHAPHALIANLLIVSFLKGLLWPSLGSIIYHSIELEKQDVVFFCCALASRLSDTTVDLALGQLLFWGFSWRSSLACFGTSFGVVFVGAILALQQCLALGVHVAVEESPSSPTWRASYSAKWFRLLGDLSAWMAFSVLLGTCGLWSLGGYLAVMLQEQFHLSPGAAATAAGSLLGGTFVGLLLAGLVTYLKGRTVGRFVQLVQGNVGLLAMVLMATCCEVKGYFMLFHLPHVFRFPKKILNKRWWWLLWLLFSLNAYFPVRWWCRNLDSWSGVFACCWQEQVLDLCCICPTLYIAPPFHAHNVPSPWECWIASPNSLVVACRPFLEICGSSYPSKQDKWCTMLPRWALPLLQVPRCCSIKELGRKTIPTSKTFLERKSGALTRDAWWIQKKLSPKTTRNWQCQHVLFFGVTTYSSSYSQSKVVNYMLYTKVAARATGLYGP